MLSAGIQRAAPSLLALAFVTLAACGGDRPAPAGSGHGGAGDTFDSTDDLAGGQAAEQAAGGDGGDDQNSPSEHDQLISAEYATYNTDFYHNRLTATDGGSWIGMWNVEVGDTPLLLAADQRSGTWAAPTALSPAHAIGPQLVASGDTAMAGWQQRNVDGGLILGSEINFRHYDSGHWQPVVRVGEVAGNDNSHYVSDLSLAALPDGGYAAVWSQRLAGEQRQLFSQWQAGDWSTPVTVANSGPHVVENALVVAADGTLSYLHVAADPATPEQTEMGFWVRDRLSGVWQSAQRVDALTPPNGLRVESQLRPRIAGSVSGRQMLAWEIVFRDSVNELHYGVAARIREAPGLGWSPAHIVQTSRRSLSFAEPVINDAGAAALLWTQSDADGSDGVGLARHTLAQGWLASIENLLDAEYFPTLTTVTQADVSGGDSYQLQLVDDRIFLRVLAAVQQENPASSYNALLSGEVGFSSSAIVDPIEVVRSLSAQFLSCAASGLRVRCSRKVWVYRFTTNPNRLLTESIKIVDLP